MSHNNCQYRFEYVAAERYDEENWWEGSYLRCFQNLRKGQPRSLLTKVLAVEEASSEHGGKNADMPEGHYSDWKRDPGPREVGMKVGDRPLKKVDEHAPSPSS
jgi:hypothetical protein